LKTGILPPLVELLRRAAAPVLAATLIRSGATTDPIAGDHSDGNLPPRYRQEVLNKASLPGCEFVNLGPDGVDPIANEAARTVGSICGCGEQGLVGRFKHTIPSTMLIELVTSSTPYRHTNSR